MTTYVAFLRGVNLGPHNKMSMARLKALAEGLGYTDVWTYLNSGNLVLTSGKRPATLEKEIDGALRQEYGSSLGVTVRSHAQLRALLADHPYPDAAPSKVAVALLSATPPAGARDRVAGVATEAEPFTFAGNDVWVVFGDGQAKSKLAATFSRVVGVSATVRTVGTLTKILAKLEAG